MSYGVDWICRACGWGNLDIRNQCRNCQAAKPAEQQTAAEIFRKAFPNAVPVTVEPMGCDCQHHLYIRRDGRVGSVAGTGLLLKSDDLLSGLPHIVDDGREQLLVHERRQFACEPADIVVTRRHGVAGGEDLHDQGGDAVGEGEKRRCPGALDLLLHHLGRLLRWPAKLRDSLVRDKAGRS